MGKDLEDFLEKRYDVRISDLSRVERLVCVLVCVCVCVCVYYYMFQCSVL